MWMEAARDELPMRTVRMPHSSIEYGRPARRMLRGDPMNGVNFGKERVDKPGKVPLCGTGKRLIVRR